MLALVTVTFRQTRWRNGAFRFRRRLLEMLSVVTQEKNSK